MSNKDIATLNILIIASGDLWAGAEVQVYYLAQALQKFPNVNLHVALMNDFALAKKLQTLGIETSIFDEAKLTGLQILRGLITLANQIHPDIIHTHRQKENILGSIASLFIKNSHCLRTQHGDEENFPGIFQIHKIIYRWLDRFCGKFLQQKIISVSDELTQKLSTKYPPEKIVTVYNGINIDEVKRRADEFTALLPGNPDACKIGIFARLVPVKRLDIFVDIAAILHARKPQDFNFYIFGDGPLNSDIRQMISSKNLATTVYMMGHQDNVYPYMKQMDCILITSNHEGLPMNLLEAMCLKTPVIAHAVGGIPLALENGNSGFLISENIAANYAEKISALRASQQLDEKTESAYQYCVSNYSSLNTCHKVLEVYRSLL